MKTSGVIECGNLCESFSVSASKQGFCTYQEDSPPRIVSPYVTEDKARKASRWCPRSGGHLKLSEIEAVSTS